MKLTKDPSHAMVAGGYLYAYTIREVRGGEIETICGSWASVSPISSQDQYIETVKSIAELAGFKKGVMVSFSLICSPELAEEKTLEQHRAEFEEWGAANGLNLQLSPYGGYEKGYTLDAWAAWKAARGIAE